MGNVGKFFGCGLEAVGWARKMVRRKGEGQGGMDDMIESSNDGELHGKSAGNVTMEGKKRFRRAG